MKISHVQIYKYKLPLKKDFFLKGKPLSDREGLIIHLVSDLGVSGLGEISPLVGLSEETLDEVIDQVQDLKEFLMDANIPEFVENLNGKFFDWLGDQSLYPSVQFGIEMAILSMISNQEKKPLQQILSAASYKDSVALTALLQGNVEEVVSEVDRLFHQGYRDFKLKVGSDVKQDVLKVKEINAVLKGKALLHCDANQMWTSDEAKTFIENVGLGALAYIEDPLQKVEDIPKLFDQTLMSFALDQPLHTEGVNDILRMEGVDVWVLKPSLLGIEKLWQLVKLGRKRGLSLVVSSTFETDIGLRTLAQLASAGDRAMSLGIDTLKYFDGRLSQKNFSWENGKIDVSSIYLNEQDLDKQYLSEL